MSYHWSVGLTPLTRVSKPSSFLCSLSDLLGPLLRSSLSLVFSDLSGGPLSLVSFGTQGFLLRSSRSCPIIFFFFFKVQQVIVPCPMVSVNYMVLLKTCGN